MVLRLSSRPHLMRPGTRLLPTAPRPKKTLSTCKVLEALVSRVKLENSKTQNQNPICNFFECTHAKIVRRSLCQFQMEFQFSSHTSSGPQRWWQSRTISGESNLNAMGLEMEMEMEMDVGTRGSQATFDGTGSRTKNYRLASYFS